MKKWYSFQLLWLIAIIGLIATFVFGLYSGLVVFLLVFIYLVAGIFEIRLSVYLENINILKTTKKIVSLTFDDGPIEKTNKVLDILQTKKVKATFFCIGENVEKHPEIVKRILAEGHSLGSHTQHHGWKYAFESRKNIENEIKKGIETLQKVTGIPAVLFRAPFGVTNPSIAYAIEKLQLKPIGWTIRSLDTQSKDTEQLKNKILKKIKEGSIILLHDYVDVTIEMLPALIDEVRKAGYEFVSLNSNSRGR
jgi:peptidoglycan/xylan/chitin deacetylase (PgdA/CDA1 family)